MITQIDSQPVSDADDFLRQVGARAPADELQLAIRREDPLLGRERQLTLSVALSKKFIGQSRPAIVTAERAEWRGLRVDYATAIADLLGRLDQIDPEGCVTVVEVRADSPAWQAGLRPNMFISHVEQERVATPQAFLQAAGQHAGVVTVRASTENGPLTLAVSSAATGDADADPEPPRPAAAAAPP